MSSTLALDMSMRSSGLVVLDDKNNMVHFEIIKTTPSQFKFEEDMILYIIGKVIYNIDVHKVQNFVIEGLSIMGKSAKRDLIDGLHWSIRTSVREYFPDILIGCIPVTQWRNSFFTKEQFKDSKEKCGKNYLKDIVFNNLPEDVKRQFLLYVEAEGMKIESVYDLADAYHIGIYRNNLE